MFRRPHVSGILVGIEAIAFVIQVVGTVLLQVLGIVILIVPFGVGLSSGESGGAWVLWAELGIFAIVAVIAALRFPFLHVTTSIHSGILYVFATMIGGGMVLGSIPLLILAALKSS